MVTPRLLQWLTGTCHRACDPRRCALAAVVARPTMAAASSARAAQPPHVLTDLERVVDDVPETAGPRLFVGFGVGMGYTTKEAPMSSKEADQVTGTEETSRSEAARGAARDA